MAMNPSWKGSKGAKCRAPTVNMILRRVGFAFSETRPFAANGGKSSASWTGLHAGTYAVILHTENDNPARATMRESRPTRRTDSRCTARGIARRGRAPPIRGVGGSGSGAESSASAGGSGSATTTSAGSTTSSGSSSSRGSGGSAAVSFKGLAFNETNGKCTDVDKLGLSWFYACSGTTGCNCHQSGVRSASVGFVGKAQLGAGPEQNLCSRP